ncbi:hypothetical protein ACFQAT_01615 [Undibacterium arcticum]|uniref:BON domain-containing protein n=1 Tax=Undibacterium arcticum TaxID=1762892 RepID=A0ABV7EZV3_9BURK
MKRLVRYGAWCLSTMLANPAAAADDARANRGNDPFFQVSSAIPACPLPLGPLQTQHEWREQAHYRAERGTSCWAEGRCRLPNSYRYDTEIAAAVQRRLAYIEPAMHWHEKTTLWLLLQRRFIYLQGCVAPDFDSRQFLLELGKTADVEQVIDQTTADPRAKLLPYRTLAEPDKALAKPGQ